MTGRPVSRAPVAGAAPDAAFLTAATLLAAFGLVAIHSATSPFAGSGSPIASDFGRHAVALVAGIGLATLLARLPLGAWRVLALPGWLAACGLLVATLVAGTEVNGAQRWLELPGVGFRFQPAELAKLATVVAVAAVLARHDGPPTSPSRLCAPALLALVPAGLLAAQPDLGNAVVIPLLVGAMLFVAGAPLRAFLWPTLIGIVAVCGYVVTRAYAWARLTGFVDPWARSDAEGFQLVQSFVAFARGGLFGVGLGDGRQKLYYLPEVHTDFILAVVAEEVGAVGVLCVLGAFGALAVAGIRIARGARDRFGLFLAFGATLLLAVPAILNAAVVTGSIPTKGLPLPFLSYGRTALVASLAAVGLVLAVARRSDARPARFRR